LKNSFRVITYDVRGHGKTHPGEKEFSIDLFTEDLIGLLDKLQIQKCAVGGLSMGGYIALNALEKYPQRFTSAILAATQCFADTKGTKDNRMKAIESIREKGLEEYADESLKRLFAPKSITARKEEVRAVREMITNTPKQTVIDTLQALAHRKETCLQLPKIKIPVLITVGKEDAITPPEASEFMHHELTNSELIVIEHSGHLAHLENTHEFNSHLKKFTEKLLQDEVNAVNV
jgi:3-oxoadipate enol-lactonase